MSSSNPCCWQRATNRLTHYFHNLSATHVEPIIKGIIRYKLHFNPYHATEQAEAEDLHQEVMVQLLMKLQQLRQEPTRALDQ